MRNRSIPFGYWYQNGVLATHPQESQTVAFQVPDSLFQRVKAYLERNHLTQKQFVIGLIEACLLYTSPSPRD